MVHPVERPVEHACMNFRVMANRPGLADALADAHDTLCYSCYSYRPTFRSPPEKRSEIIAQ